MAKGQNNPSQWGAPAGGTKPMDAAGLQNHFNTLTSGLTGTDPAKLQQFKDMWGQIQPGATVQAGTPPVGAGTAPTTGVAPTGVAPTGMDTVYGPSWNTAQPSAQAMAGAAVQPIQQAAPPKPVAPAPKKPATPDPAQGYGVVDPKIQAQAWDMYMRGAGMGGGSYGYNAATSKAFGDQQRQMLGLSQNANPATKAMVAALNQRMVDMFNNRRGGARQGGSR